VTRRDRLTARSQAAFAEAVRHHQDGRLAEAEALYRSVLAAHPRHADSLHLLGVLAHQAGRHAAAVALIDAAIAIDAEAPVYFCNLGNALQAAGRLDDAIAAYRNALALQPGYPEVSCNLGIALLGCGEIDAAADTLTGAIAQQPNMAEAHNALGNALVALGRIEAAIGSYRRAVAHRPGYADALSNLGAALRDAGDPEGAVTCFRRALAADPALAAAGLNLGIALRRLGRLDDAEAAARAAVARAPELPEAHDSLGSVLADQGRLEAAADSFRHALQLRPAYAAAQDNLGTVLKEMGRVEAAIDCFRAAVATQPDLANAHHNLAMALLATGAMAEAWPEYEWRWRTPRMAAAARAFAQPQWRGEPAAGRTLLIHAEQGFGDSIQFCRYATLAAAGGWRVILEAPPTLVRLLRGLDGVAQVIARGDALPAFDLQCPMLSLPLAFGTTLETIPASVPYLHADAAAADTWAGRLGTGALRVGLAWAGSPATIADRRRSIPPALLAPLLDVAGVELFSLQKTPDPAADPRIRDVMAEMGDFADTAALVANLDLVIAVDTAVAHLAAALGRPVWLLDRFDPDWRWLLGRQDSPWYPTLRIYRQPAPGDWHNVIAAVAADFAKTARRQFSSSLSQ
jgi:tetratricopeptide (TPR) repeat protein